MEIRSWRSCWRLLEAAVGVGKTSFFLNEARNGPRNGKQVKKHPAPDLPAGTGEDIEVEDLEVLLQAADCTKFLGVRNGSCCFLIQMSKHF